MSVRKLLALLLLAGLAGSTAACSDVTGPKTQAGVCTVTGSGQTCDPT
jgi:hypothetical protein